MKREQKINGGSFNDMDVSQALQGWTFEPGQVNVRLIRGNDGKPKLQLRLDLGLLQMELDGRPDGRKPHRAATELDFQKRKLGSHFKRHGSDTGFHLTPRDCQSLREESAMFYHRYLSMFVLEQYDAVVRDTQHNLDVLDLCRRYGNSDYDRGCMEQYRAYVLMMNIRAKSCDALRLGFVQTAIAYLRGGVRQIAHLVPREERKKVLRHSHEARILLDMLRQIRTQLPMDPRVALRSRLNKAVALEKFEEAARLRDELEAMIASMAQPRSGKSRQPDATPGAPGLPPAMPASKSPAKKVRKRRARKMDGPRDGDSGES